MTRISWGRRAADEARVSRTQALLIALAVVVGLTASVDGFVHRSIVDQEAHYRVQLLLDQYLRTIELGNDFHYSLTLDRQNPAHTRCMSEQFARGGERVAELRPNRLIRLEETTRDTALVRALVRRRDGVEAVYVRRAQLINILTLPPFDIRRVSFIWYLGSPTDAELGGQTITSAGDGTLMSWAIDAPGREAVERELDALRDEFLRPPTEAPGATAPPPLRVRLLPAPELGPNGCVSGPVYDHQGREIVLYPLWADAERSSLSEWTRAELREAFQEWERAGAGT